MKESMSQDNHDTHDVVDCRSAMDRLFEMLDGELTPERERQVRAHIVGCPGCFAHAGDRRVRPAHPPGVRKRR